MALPSHAPSATAASICLHLAAGSFPPRCWRGAGAAASPTCLHLPPVPSRSYRCRRYEKARKLKDFIGGIRDTYTRNWDSRDRAERQVRAGPAAAGGA